MSYQFSILFKLIVNHTYFKDGICRCIELSPGPMSSQLVKRSYCLSTASNNTFAFFGRNSGKAFLDHINQATGVDHIDIEMTCTDSDFRIFTDLPLQHRGALNYSTRDSRNYIKDGCLRLQESEDGDYRVHPLGIVKIYFEDILKYGNKQRPAAFGIDFNSRPTQWQYYIINKSGADLQNIVIKKADFTLMGPKMVTTKNGEEALFFSSGNRLIELKEAPEHRFSLSRYAENIASSSKTIIKALPCPRPSHFELTEVNGTKEVASPMYVSI